MNDRIGPWTWTVFCGIAVLLTWLVGWQTSEAIETQRFEPPRSVGVWQRSASPLVIDESGIFNYMDGAGELYLSYRFKQLNVHRYQAEGQSGIVTEIYFMESPDDAFGLLSQDWNGEAIEFKPHSMPAKLQLKKAPAARALYARGLLRMGSNAVFIRVMALQETPESRQAVLSIGHALTAGQPYLDEPDLLDQLPSEIPGKWQLQPDQLRFLRSYMILNSFYYVSLDNIFNLALSDEAVTVLYERKNSHANPLQIRVLLVKYANAEKAGQASALFANSYVTERREKSPLDGDCGPDRCLQVEDGWIGFRLKGRFIAFVFQCPDVSTVRSVLSAFFATR